MTREQLTQMARTALEQADEAEIAVTIVKEAIGDMYAAINNVLDAAYYADSAADKARYAAKELLDALDELETEGEK